jgi:hypothetical protein
VDSTSPRRFFPVASPIAGGLRAQMPAHSLGVFVLLQLLDLLTTLIGLRLGAKEANTFVGQLIRMGPMAGLLISKIFAVLFAATALKFKRARLIVFLNFWFTLIVSWNLVMIFASALRLSK